jgi:hypothetical protein
MKQREYQAFWTLRASDMAFSAAQWELHYPALSQWLWCPDAEIRSCAVERLLMAVIWAEPNCTPYRERDNAAALSRLAWVLFEVEAAHAQHIDVIPAMLKHLVFTGNHEPFRTPLCKWLEDLLAKPRRGVDAHVVRGIQILLSPVESDWTTHSIRLIALLDDVSDFVRACAARELGQIYDDDCVNPSASELLLFISEKELQRPGIAGPFWCWTRVGTDNGEWEKETLWMLDLLERRKGKVPSDLPFNDIDFHLHELCRQSPTLVRRMMRGGFEELAVMTATEELHIVEGMEPILKDLAQSTNSRIAASAKSHLERFYVATPIC